MRSRLAVKIPNDTANKSIAAIASHFQYGATVAAVLIDEANCDWIDRRRLAGARSKSCALANAPRNALSALNDALHSVQDCR